MTESIISDAIERVAKQRPRTAGEVNSLMMAELGNLIVTDEDRDDYLRERAEHLGLDPNDYFERDEDVREHDDIDYYAHEYKELDGGA